MAPRREHAERHRDEDGGHQRHGRERHRGLDALADQFDHRLLHEVRLAEVALQQLRAPVEELHGQRLVEPQLLAHLGDVFAGAAVAHDGGGRVAGREPQHQEHDERDDDEHRHGRENAACKKKQHGGSRVRPRQFFFRFQNTATGERTTPLTTPLR
ncbi:hypothetical protein FQZ97_959670 [compost metagenome]